MKLTVASLALSLSLASAHYVYPGLIANGVRTGQWTHVRPTIERFNMSPVQDVLSSRIRCNVDPAVAPATEVLTVAAGSQVGFWMQSGISHQGPLMIYLAKAPSGVSAKDFDGSGAVWFKVYELGGEMGQWNQMSWPATGISQPSVTLPSSLPSGDYLIRVEHIALHGAYEPNGAQHYLACGQIRVTGGGNGTPGPLVSFPGAYKPTDPGILYNMYSNSGAYPIPGPAVWKG